MDNLLNDNIIEELRTIYTCLDHTSLSDTDTERSVVQFCEETLRMAESTPNAGHVASVCVYPLYAGAASRVLKGSGIKVASVAGAFPTGQSPLEIRISEIHNALDHGADEIDTVIRRGLVLEGNTQQVEDELYAIREACGTSTLKVIIETCQLPTEQLVRTATELAIHCGADFVKTSTGKSTAGATLDASQIMIETLEKYYQETGKIVGFKAAGGISTPDQAYSYFRMCKHLLSKKTFPSQVFRIGTSRLTPLLLQYLTA